MNNITLHVHVHVHVHAHLYVPHPLSYEATVWGCPLSRRRPLNRKPSDEFDDVTRRTPESVWSVSMSVWQCRLACS